MAVRKEPSADNRLAPVALAAAATAVTAGKQSEKIAKSFDKSQFVEMMEAIYKSVKEEPLDI